jgi:RNA processing factor Prp31
MKDIANNLKRIDEKTYRELLESSNNLKEFQRSIADLINNQINAVFPDNDEIKTRM